MNEQTDYQVMALANGKPVKMWTAGVPVEADARRQLQNTARMPFVFRHLAVMPDVHLGKGSTIGTVIPTQGAIIPAAVGVDIGCGMMAARTTLKAADLPDSLHGLRGAIERAVPHGRAPGRRDPGAWGDRPPHAVDEAWKTLVPGFERIRADEQPCPPGDTRHGQSLHRSLPRRKRHGLVHAP